MRKKRGQRASAPVSLAMEGPPVHPLHTVSKQCCPSPASIPLEAVRAEWERTCGPYHKQRLAEYYGLYRDLFHGATFVPWVPLHVAYALGEEDLIPVYHGNEVTPTEVLLPRPPPCSLNTGTAVTASSQGLGLKFVTVCDF